MRSVAVIGVVCSSFVGAAVALAQDAGVAVQEGSSRAGEFVAMTGPPRETVQGGTLLIAAYAVVWTLVLLYVVRIGLVQARTASELARLGKIVRATGSDAGKKDA